MSQQNCEKNIIASHNEQSKQRNCPVDGVHYARIRDVHLFKFLGYAKSYI